MLFSTKINQWTNLNKSLGWTDQKIWLTEIKSKIHPYALFDMTDVACDLLMIDQFSSAWAFDS